MFQIIKLMIIFLFVLNFPIIIKKLYNFCTKTFVLAFIINRLDMSKEKPYRWIPKHFFQRHVDYTIKKFK